MGDEEAQDQREGDNEQDEKEHNHAGHHHGHGDAPASPLPALFQFDAIATLILSVLAVTTEFFELLERDPS